MRWVGLVCIWGLVPACSRKADPIRQDPSPSTTVTATPVAPEAPPRDCPVDMAGLPGGTFKIFKGGYHTPVYDKDLRQVEVKPYCLDKTEVTVAAYGACVKGGACTEPTAFDPDPKPPLVPRLKSMNWKNPDPLRLQHPVNGVKWSQAVDYCKWKGRRLPSEEEVEWAMRGGTKATKYPWGNEPIAAERANLADSAWHAVCASTFECAGVFPEKHWSDGHAFTAPVGSFPKGANPWGVQDLVGNVEEWTASREVVDDQDAVWVRGGSYNTPPDLFDHAAANGRYGVYVEVRIGSTVQPQGIEPDIGFRCAR